MYINLLRQIARVLLIVAFLSGQWLPQHIHLPQKHDHDGDFHQHGLLVHADHALERLVRLDLPLRSPSLSHPPGENGVVYVDNLFGSANGKSRLSKITPESVLPPRIRAAQAPAFSHTLAAMPLAPPGRNRPELPRSRAPPTIA